MAFRVRKRLAFYPPDYDSPGLGGSEAVLVLLARSLAKRGHEVTVFNCPYRPGRYDDVDWRPLYELHDVHGPDVRVSVRYEESIAMAPGARNLFWMLDNRPEDAATFTRSDGEGAVVVASRAMQSLLGAAGVEAPVHIIPHPVETTLYQTVEATSSRRPVCIYTSIPDRGLDIALAIWPQIRAAIPDAELHITSGYELWGLNRTEARVLNSRAGVRPDDANNDGIHYLGVVDRMRLRRLQSRASLMLYPCRDEEMFCLAVAEAAAAGTPAVTSNAFALAERVIDGRTGFLIDGAIEEPLVQRLFAEKTIALLSDESLRSKMAVAAQEFIRPLACDDVARQWERIAL